MTTFASKGLLKGHISQARGEIQAGFGQLGMGRQTLCLIGPVFSGSSCFKVQGPRGIYYRYVQAWTLQRVGLQSLAASGFFPKPETQPKALDLTANAPGERIREASIS